ncbi:DnaQ-like DNA polymerase III subunit [Gordonia phage Harambe]|uniref:DnaQ-like DNA polymerase III subunit n=8 Tax=Woesvirus woes TaxID=1982751 RepID=A0A482JHZ0_9CAUD|nr:DnaQ-like DNA polymerase III subunit [Gordonia phage Guillaume]QAX94660.1 DnaQ-like DNA polymerase III subunit [Gordonia phage Harambe]QAX95323.1 DnaQ-like DNA polymerase III subunit [Gordonia phage Hello]QAX95415.1 DnaQ-like DNA polymerase III subunit [Gordonia phage Neoevie]QBP30331.1 DnaQ-like DNA polymerase III subunit [Gordonia phage Jormungandr]QBP30626.1 DnaQ-like DNA polymerase III subunit [Gordonia phage Lahirium]QBP31829.1 DnaQ-like DNA polymerase III subunit [Gordonia phage Nimi
MSKAVFIDLETTGLNPVTEEIIEFAIMVVDTDTWEQVEGQTLAGLVFTPQIVQRLNDDSFVKPVREMHNKNGLFPKLRKFIDNGTATSTYEEVEARILGRLKDFQIKGLPVWGSSVHFDRKFLEQKMPKLNDYFHYRVVDSSSDMERLKATRPDLWKKIDNDPSKYVSPPEAPNHRALEDLRHSVDLERRIAKWVTGPAAACADLQGA